MKSPILGAGYVGQRDPSFCRMQTPLEVGQDWLDTSTQPAQVRRYLGDGGWKLIGGLGAGLSFIGFYDTDSNQPLDQAVYR